MIPGDRWFLQHFAYDHNVNEPAVTVLWIANDVNIYSVCRSVKTLPFRGGQHFMPRTWEVGSGVDYEN